MARTEFDSTLGRFWRGFGALRLVSSLGLVAVALLTAAGCSSSSDAGGSGAECTQGVPHTDFASCQSDDECYSGFCCLLGMAGCGHQSNFPGYCLHPNTSAYKAGHGYACSSDADCDKVAPDFLKIGGHGHCYNDAINDVPNGCGFNCTASAGSNNTSGGASGGGLPLTGGASSVGGSGGGPPPTAGASSSGGIRGGGGG